MRRDRCRSCDAAIIWARTAGGRAMPVDAEPSVDGNLILVGDVAEHVSADQQSALFDGGDRYTSHFSTCPQAKSWRKR